MGRYVPKKILTFSKKLTQTTARFLEWLYHNLFMRLWLGFAGLIGISTMSTCPCCGQPACPTGFAIPAVLGGVLAGLGIFRKKIGAFFGKFFLKKFDTASRPAPLTRTRVLSWILILLVIAVVVRFGNSYFVKAAPKHMWQQPMERVVNPRAIAPPHTVVAQTPKTTDALIEKPAENKLTQVAAIPVQNKDKPLSGIKKGSGEAKSPEGIKETPRLERMRALIGPDGAVQIKKEIIDVVHYETLRFLEMNDDIYARLDLYEGKKVEIEGFVFRRSDFKPNQFVTARLYMWCCAFDAAPVGPLCESTRASDFENNAWVRVEGTITKQFDDNAFIPVIQVEKVTRIPKPESPYVYTARNKVPFRLDHRSK